MRLVKYILINCDAFRYSYSNSDFILDEESNEETISPRSPSRGSRASRLGSAVISPTAAAAKRKHDTKEYLEEHAAELQNFFNARNVEAIIRVIRHTLDAMKRRVAATSSVNYIESSIGVKEEVQPNAAFFRSDIVLAIPNITMQPALDDIQQAINKASSMVVHVSKGVDQWNEECRALQKEENVKKDEFVTAKKDIDSESQAQRSRGASFNSAHDEGASDHASPRSKASIREQSVMFMAPMTAASQKKSYFKNIVENKEVAKLLSLMQTIVNSQKKAVTTALEQFSRYESMWKDDKETKMKEFLELNPNLGEFEVNILQMTDMEATISQEPESYNVGAIALYTGSCLYSLH